MPDSVANRFVTGAIFLTCLHKMNCMKLFWHARQCGRTEIHFVSFSVANAHFRRRVANALPGLRQVVPRCKLRAVVACRAV